MRCPLPTVLALMLPMLGLPGCGAIKEVLWGDNLAQGALPNPPTAAQISQADSAEKKEFLIRKYSVHVEDETVRVGDAVRSAHGAGPLARVEPQVRQYLQSQPQTNTLLPTGAWEAAGTVAVGLLAAGPVLLFLGMPLSLAGAVVGVGILDRVQQGAFANAAARTFNMPITIAVSVVLTFSLIFVGWVGTAPGFILLSAGGILWSTVYNHTQDRVAAAAAQFNRELARQVAAPAQPVEPLP